ncbi:dTMP kinase [Aestuariibacter sp. AA17]|uniref:Thymidylate kinase n=1 Tax=Fluctibacter corallii TaxID=2984329 RepID=A0ABT3A6G9_9ALTE|nr:dTMP kinase [Aestuariibacter sp. AA17]MCV2884271.1 dTMP kinase [Aestuariibacter sp. AA17]
MKGKFVVVEGLEGAGKSSALNLINTLIQAQGIDVVNTREPGGTPMAEAIRECVKGDWATENVTVEAELLLMYASRVQLVENVIKPALNEGAWVVGDRHDLSSQAYQGGGREIPDTILKPLQEITLKGFKPDLTLYLDIAPELGLERARGRGELDRIERAGLAFFERTRQRYLDLAMHDSSIVTIDASQPMEKVHADISEAITRYLQSHV